MAMPRKVRKMKKKKGIRAQRMKLLSPPRVADSPIGMKNRMTEKKIMDQTVGVFCNPLSACMGYI